MDAHCQLLGWLQKKTAWATCLMTDCNVLHEEPHCVTGSQISSAAFPSSFWHIGSGWGDNIILCNRRILIAFSKNEFIATCQVLHEYPKLAVFPTFSSLIDNIVTIRDLMSVPIICQWIVINIQGQETLHVFLVTKFPQQNHPTSLCSYFTYS